MARLVWEVVVQAPGVVGRGSNPLPSVFGKGEEGDGTPLPLHSSPSGTSLRMLDLPPPPHPFFLCGKESRDGEGGLGPSRSSNSENGFQTPPPLLPIQAR